MVKIWREIKARNKHVVIIEFKNKKHNKKNKKSYET